LRFPLERQKLSLSIPVHLAGCVLAVLLCELAPRPDVPGPGQPPGPARERLAGGPPENRPPLRPDRRPQDFPPDRPLRPENMPPDRQMPPPPGAPRPGFLRNALIKARVNLPVYWVIVSIVHALNYYRRSQERD